MQTPFEYAKYGDLQPFVEKRTLTLLPDGTPGMVEWRYSGPDWKALNVDDTQPFDGIGKVYKTMWVSPDEDQNVVVFSTTWKLLAIGTKREHGALTIGVLEHSKHQVENFWAFEEEWKSMGGDDFDLYNHKAPHLLG